MDILFLMTKSEESIDVGWRRGKGASTSYLPSRVVIDFDALGGNTRALKAHVGVDIAIMAVVKANAYGHGAVSVARTVLQNGADSLAVANLPEALQLREAGIKAPILVLSYVPFRAVPIAIAHDIAIALYDVQQALLFQEAANTAGAPLKTHIKIDSGMGRLGILPRDVPSLSSALKSCDSIYAEGIYTHFASAEEDPVYTAQQVKTFERALNCLRDAGHRFQYVHAANSAATMNPPAGRFNVARPGLLLYGLKPVESIGGIAGLRPVMSWKTVIAQVKTLPAGSPIGYGNAYRTRTEERIAVLPVGYADGLRRSPRSWREVLVHGMRAPIVGRVSMEKTTVNVSHIPNVRAGDEVTLLGRQGDDCISAEEIADWIGSNNYEVLTSILPSAPRY